MATSSDYLVLVDMGFDKERAALAVKKTGGLQGAIEWLEETQDKPLEELVGPSASTLDEDDPNAEPPALKIGEEAHSLVCTDCGKKFRSEAQASFHGAKSGHLNFEESTEEIAPLTEEEKKAKLVDLREKLAAKRATMSDQDKIDKKKNEDIRKKSTKETQDIKEDLQKKEQIKEAAAKRREKVAEVAAKEKIRAKIAADKEERRLKAEKEKAARDGRAPPAPAAAAPVATTSGPVLSKPASAYTETRLRLQTTSGNIQKSFPVDTTLFEVAAALGAESGFEAQSFVQNYPKKVFDQIDFGQTLKELGLVPSASLIVR